MNNADIIASALEKVGLNYKLIKLGPEEKIFMHILDEEGNARLTLSAVSPLYPFATASSRLICKDKAMAYDFAELQGISVPKSCYVSRADMGYQGAKDLLKDCGRVIAKPAQASLSRGLTLGICSDEQLVSAIAHARNYSGDVIVQQQIAGDEIRFPVVNGKVVAAALRQSPRVVGDGTSTVADLISRENELRASLSNTMVAYPMLDGALINPELVADQRVLSDGEVLVLNNSTMISGGASVYNVLDEVHPEYIELIEKLARPLGPGFVVADVVFEDYRQFHEAGYWFMEFNLTPALRLFYSCRDGEHITIAEEHLAPMMAGILSSGR